MGVLTAVVVGVGSGSVVGCASDMPERPTDPVLATGYDVYNAQCAQCHGVNGGGGVGKRLAGTVTETFPNLDDHVAVIAQGRPGTNMPAFEDRLTADEIEAVARYERESLG